MSLHQKSENKKPDSCFQRGTLYHLVPGNKGRVLDGRRTPGLIERYDGESAMFVWKITDFEDKGRHWEIPAEDISSYQFEKSSKKLSKEEVMVIESKCRLFSEKAVIPGLESEFKRTAQLIQDKKEDAKSWFQSQSQFVKMGEPRLDLHSTTGIRPLYNDLESYLKINGVLDLEKKTACQFLLNPRSGEWIKGLRIVMAEMGLLDFNEKRPRTKDIFQGIGCKKKRRQYIISRMAFLQVFLELAGYKEVQLFRGMSTEGAWYETPRTLVSVSFNPEAAKSFSQIDRNEQITCSYLVKFVYPIENLFMTFFETKAFNDRYPEQEAVILYRTKVTF